MTDAWITRTGSSYTWLSSGDGFYAMLKVPANTALSLRFAKPGLPACTRTIAGLAPGSVTRINVRLESQPMEVWRDDRFTTSGDLTPPGTSVEGWSRFGMDNAMAWSDRDTTQASYRGWLAPDADHFRTAGASANLASWMPYSLIGPDRVVRAKYCMYAGGQTDPGDLNQIPNLRLRLSNRFAVNSMLEVFHHNTGEQDQTQRAMDAELRPSTDPTKPSLYRVDFDPVDVPFLASNSSVEGVQRAFEAFGIYPEDQGYVAMIESVIGSYPASAMATAIPELKAYAPDGTGPGDLGVFEDAELNLANIIPGMEEGAYGTRQAEAPPSIPSYSEGPSGVTLDSADVPIDRIGVATRDFNPDRATDSYSTRARVDEGRQYSVRFHLTSTQLTNRQSQIRLRARTVKFAWSQKLEIGGAWGTDAGKTYPLNANNSIAQQALPGLGTANPDTSGSETAGGWYTMVVQTPMSADIRPEFAPGTPLSTRMPTLAAQPGLGVNAFSRRDLLVGIDLVDTLSAGIGSPFEQGNVTLDRIEVRAYDLSPD